MIVHSFIATCSFRVGVVVHVGANKASEAGRYETMGAERVIWVEADREMAARCAASLAERAPTPTTHVVAQALITDRDGVETAFHVFSNKGSSSSIFQSTPRAREAWPTVRETGKVKSYVSTRLDTLLRGLSIDPAEVGLLVIDVQGAELLCLKGAGAYLEAATFLELEMSQEALYAGGALAPEVDAFLTEAGFTRMSNIQWHGDVAYVRADRLGQGATAKLRHITSALT